MSLLLQALKKAEESKHQHELASEILSAQTSKILDFPVLEEPVIPASPSNTNLPEPLSPKETPIESFQSVSELTPVATTARTLDFAPEPFTEVAQALATDEISTDIEPMAPPPSSAPSPQLPLNISPEEGALHLLSAPRVRIQYRLAGWLVLGGCILLGGVGMGFWWQIESFSVPESLPVASATSATYSLTASAPVASASINSPIVTVAAVPDRSATQAPKIRPSPVSRPPINNLAAYIEPQPIPAGLPKIERQVHESTIPAPLESAWRAYQHGDLASAETQYRHMLTLDPRNRDVLLGLAAVAASKGLKQEAVGWYKRLLALNSQDQDAQSGLLAISPDTLNERSEAQLLQQTGRADAPLLLAQHYAAHNRWHEAQEQYFQAFTQNPGNADLAFNLAVSLDHISHPRQAANYYRKALELGKGSFDRSAAERRLAEILPEVR